MNAPVFLQKTYDMLTACPVDVAEWSKHGRSFVVKQTKLFEATMLPQFFKHNNFASFARQLRFYGFEKSKVHDARFSDAGETGQSWWLFQHPKFLRDDPAKMVSIRRKTCTEAVVAKWEAGEVSDLKDRLSTLQDTMTTLSAQIESLTAAVHTYAAESSADEDEHDENNFVVAPSAKKAKLTDAAVVVLATSPKTVDDIPTMDQAWSFDLDDDAFPDVDEQLMATLMDFDLPIVC
ncbi:Aste57867_591 [Aphanomyces stellatus]|uniref:Aste57867_591 protein n=1 Tax=Aphanomyces stellatus TaxID=120398 RepID=A0A485K678_9STRA|nr:hypothetical protein As57867_000590 [Aphanomyces stellatus]VFT77816.1 Aste57867_591 [Aphanomyces stellatus]